MTTSSKPDPSLTLLRTTLRRAPHFFGILLALTAILLTWHHFGMERIVELSARSSFTYDPDSDRADGGLSDVKVQRVGNTLKLNCNLVKKVEWPYCKIRFNIGTPAKGIDLSQFQSVSIDAGYTSPTQPQARLSLVNFDEGFSREGGENWLYNKINEAEAFTLDVRKPVVLPLDVFFPASWWIARARPPIEFTGRRIDHVMHVELQSASNSPLGPHVLEIRAIRFHGKMITKNQLLMLLISIWITSAIGLPALLSLMLRRELNTSKAELRLLAQVNSALKLETEQLAGQAHHDALTGVLNREGLRAELMATSALLSDPASIIFIDIDHFKQINDGHGHAAGDIVLKHFAVTIAANVRGSDRLVRWGGEEFLLVCPGSDVHQAAALAEKLRVSLTRETWPNSLKLTASFGVAQHNVNEEIGNVIKRADYQLYGAKRSGRNRVHADFGGGRPAGGDVPKAQAESVSQGGL